MTDQFTLENESKYSLYLNLLTRFGGYFDGQLYRFVAENGVLKLTESVNNDCIKILVISSDYYNERAESFPVDNTKELKSLLKLHLEKNDFHLVQSSSEGHSKINVWRFTENLPKALFYLPESLLFAQLSLPREVVSVLGENKEQYVTQLDGVVYSANKQGVISSPENFAISAGCAVDVVHTLSFENKANAIFQGLKKLPLVKVLPFFKTNEEQSRQKLLKGIGLPLVFVTLMYLVLSSSYILFKSLMIKNKLVSYDEHIVLLLNSKSDLDNNALRLAQLNNYWQTRQSKAHIWAVVAPLFEFANIRSINIQNGTVVIRGSTNKTSATKLLEGIARDKNVVEAKFDTPVRKSRNVENFIISFQLVHTDNANMEDAQ